MKIYIEVIPHKQQAYDTVGDWWFNKEGDLEIRVSDLGNWKYEALVGLHEVLEAILCKDNGVSEESVTEFDELFEKDRKEGDDSEPGDDPSAPYGKYHFLATSIERIQAQALDVNWKEYDDTVNGLEYE